MYIVGNRSFNTIQEAQEHCNNCDFDYDMIIQIEPVEQTATKTENKKVGRPATINTVKELNSIIKTGKRNIERYIKEGYDRQLIYNWYELIKKDCNKYKDSNKTCKQMYYKFLDWWNKYDKQLFPEFH